MKKQEVFIAGNCIDKFGVYNLDDYSFTGILTKTKTDAVNLLKGHKDYVYRGKFTRWGRSTDWNASDYNNNKN
jgi:hypothetical protein